MGALVGDSIFEMFGTFFPLLVKFIDANDVLSIQVHPGDDLALKQFGSYGKTEMWYVIEAERNAEIIVGFNRKVTKESYLKHLNNKSLLNILNAEKTMSGDVFFLPWGRIHAIGSGILLAEIQQTSDATLRIYDFDRLDEKGKPRELHTEKALETIDFNVYPEYKTRYEKTPDQPNLLAKCEYFTTNYFEITKKLERDYNPIDSFVIYMCIEGRLSIHYRKGESEIIEKGETVLLPAEIKNVVLSPDKTARILEVYVEGKVPGEMMSELLERYF